MKSKTPQKAAPKKAAKQTAKKSAPKKDMQEGLTPMQKVSDVINNKAQM